MTLTSRSPRTSLTRVGVGAAVLALAGSVGALSSPAAQAASSAGSGATHHATAPTKAVIDGELKPLSSLKKVNAPLTLVVDQRSLDEGVVHAFTDPKAAQRFKASVPTSTGPANIWMYENTGLQGRSIYFSGANTSRNLTEFAMCFLCGSWNDQPSSYWTGGHWVDVYQDTYRRGTSVWLAPQTHADLWSVGMDNAISSYYIEP